MVDEKINYHWQLICAALLVQKEVNKPQELL